MFKKFVFLIAVSLLASPALGVETLIAKPLGEPLGLVVIAPAKKYLMEERLFTELSRKLVTEGYITVRFNWSEDTLQVPAQELERASRDINWVLQTSQKIFGMKPEQTILVSKSFSTKALLASASLAQTHFLLTPNCSAEQPFKDGYQSLFKVPYLTFRIHISNEDPYCDVGQIKATLAEWSKPFILKTTGGDHNFVAQDSSDEFKYFYQDLVIQDIIGELRFFESIEHL